MCCKFSHTRSQAVHFRGSICCMSEYWRSLQTPALQSGERWSTWTQPTCAEKSGYGQLQTRKTHNSASLHAVRGFPGGSSGKEPTCQPAQEMQKTRVWSPSRWYPLEEGMVTHSSILAWRIPWTEEPDGLRSIGLGRVRHYWSDWACTHRGSQVKQKIHNNQVDHYKARLTVTYIVQKQE